jgi:3-methyladenine DNA glycosylase Tag
MAIPEQINPTGLADYLEVMSKAVFQAGLRWSQLERRWSAFQEAFHGFNPVTIAGFTETDIDGLANDPKLIRSRNKIAATIKNAQTLLALDQEFGSFQNYLRSHGSYKQLSADLKKRFKYMGELNVYYFLFRVREPVPNFDDWIKTIEGNHPKMKEMVELARQKGQSTEQGHHQ